MALKARTAQTDVDELLPVESPDWSESLIAASQLVAGAAFAASAYAMQRLSSVLLGRL
jgi:hypothetical protein